MKFKIFLFQLMGICFTGLMSVVWASPLTTIPPPITDFFIPVNQRSVEPVRNPGDFIGRVFAPKPEDWQTRPEAQPITGVTVTIASGSRAGESVATNLSGYYRFQNVTEDELHLRVEKEHFEPKEVMVHRSRPTILANGDVPNYTRDPQQHPGNILIGHRWPDEVRFILEETLVVYDLLYVEGGRLPEGTDLGGFYSLGVVVLYSYQYADWKDIVGLLGTFAHEIAHAYQHALVSVDGSAWEIHGWKDTPEGKAYEEARRKDWEQVGKSPLDNIYGSSKHSVIAFTETAAETCAHYWSVDRWGGRTTYGLLKVEAPNRYKWAEKWVPASTVVRPPPKVVSIPDQNLAAAIRKALGLEANVPITEQAMQRLTALDARNSQIKNLTGLEHATRLGLLELRENQISDIRPLANLKKLQQLILENNRVGDISPLANMTHLTRLSIGSNPISDFTPLINLNQLEALTLWDSNIGDITLLANKTKLTNLWLGRSKISNIAPLTDLVNLKVLFLPHNQIHDVSPLAGLPNLETLHLQDNSIRDISPLAELTKLTDLRLGDNPITDKSTLRMLKERNPKLKLDIEIPPNMTVPPSTPIVYAAADINQDKKVNKTDLLLVVTVLGEKPPTNPRFDVNVDGHVNIADVLLVIEALDDPVDAAAPSLGETGTTFLDPTLLTTQIGILRVESDGSIKYKQAIAFFQGLLAITRPNKTRLLANYPNPFNPETWIPYQLADSSDVQILIYDTKGTVVRHMELGHQPAGYYTSRNRAAYWNGRNILGERVASGVYFYQLQVDDLSLLRKMIIMK